MKKKCKEFRITLGDWYWDIDLKQNQSKDFRIYDDKGYKTVRITSEIIEEKEIEKLKEVMNYNEITKPGSITNDIVLYLAEHRNKINEIIDLLNDMRDKEC